jgi:serine protease Do
MTEFDNNNPNMDGDNNNIDNNKIDNNNISNNNTSNNNINSNNVNSNNLNNNQIPINKIPEYSFWAENVQGNSQTNALHQTSVPQGQANNYDGPNASPNYSYSNQPYSNNSNPNSDYQNYSYNNYNPNTNSWSYGNVQGGMTYSKPTKEHRPMNKTVKFLIKSVCFGIIAGVTFVGFQQLFYVINPDAASSKLIGNLSKEEAEEANYEIGYTSGGSIQLEDKSSISKIVDLTMPSIVSINSTATQTSDWFGQPYSQEVEGSGSGFIVGKNEKELLIATNNHVVEGTSAIKVTFIDGTQADAVIKGTDVTADLAVVSVDITTMDNTTLEAIEVSKLGNSDGIKVGQMSIAIGNALGYGQSVTVGYISAKDREVEVSDGYSSNAMILLQTDAAINPGNSGGALLNVDGEVIGINTVKYASNEVEGMGYAIPISRAIPIINELMSREILAEEDQGYLGIIGNDVTEDVASYYNMPIGVFINELAEGGAGEKAGLLSGDIIIKADEIDITSITQLRDYVTSKRVGTEVTITYMRKSSSEYQEGTLTVTLGKNPNQSSSEE